MPYYFTWYHFDCCTPSPVYVWLGTCTPRHVPILTTRGLVSVATDIMADTYWLELLPSSGIALGHLRPRAGWVTMSTNRGAPKTSCAPHLLPNRMCVYVCCGPADSTCGRLASTSRRHSAITLLLKSSTLQKITHGCQRTLARALSA